MESRIRIKLGSVEVEYEGSNDFLKEELPVLMKTISELSKNIDVVRESVSPRVNTGYDNKLDLSTASIAGRLSCTSGPDLIVAAAAHLTIVKQVETFTRQQLLTEIRTASGYYKSTYNNNFTKYLNNLVKTKKLNEVTSGKFSLSAETRKELENRIAA